MNSKNYTEVLIGGNIYTLVGSEDEVYLQRIASYINEVISRLKKQEGFLKQSEEYQTVMAELNIADDYFKSQDQAATLEAQKRELEKEAYSLKHELVTTQMKLEAALRSLEEANKKIEAAEEEKKSNHTQIEQLKAIHAAKSNMSSNNNKR